MKLTRVIFTVMFVVVCTLLAACGGSVQTPAPNVAETPLVTDADIDNAQLLLPTEVKELVGIEGGEVVAEQVLTAPSDAVLSQQSTQMGILDPNSWIYYIQADSTPTNAPDATSLVPAPTMYSIVGQNPVTGARKLLYSGAREIQSISITTDQVSGGVEIRLLVSMRETTNFRSDFEIFFMNFRLASNEVDQLTFDDVDNINVSGRESNSLFVYEESVSGKSTIVLATPGVGQVFTLRLTSSFRQRHPNLGKGVDEIVFVRDLPNGYDSIMKYTIATNTYSTLVDTTPVNARVVTPVTLDFPSLSYNGNRVLWLENNNTVKLKNLSTGSVQTVASDPTIKRPRLSSYYDDFDGTFVTYQQGRNVYYKKMQTAQVWALTNNTSFVTSYGAVPSLRFAPPTLQVTVTGLPSGQNRVTLTGPSLPASGILFGSSRTFENLYAATYMITAQSFGINPTKPTCKIYTPTPASQAVTLSRGEARSVSVTYTVEPCVP